jgi:hypothetical protein
LPVRRCCFAPVAVCGLREPLIVGVGGEVKVQVAEEEREALQAVLIESEEYCVAVEMARVLELKDVLVGCDGTRRGESSCDVGRLIRGARDKWSVDVSRADHIPCFAAIEVRLRVPVVRKGVFNADAALKRRRLAQRSRQGANSRYVRGFCGGRERRAKRRKVDEGFRLPLAIQAVGFRCKRSRNNGGKQSRMKMENRPAVFIDRPGKARARREVREGSGRSFERVAQAAGERKP